MARPVKNNLDYFSHDKDMRNDLKIKALRRKFSHKGYAIYVMMLEHLSDCEYLQYQWDDLSIELLTPDFDIDSNELKEIMDYCIFLKLFQVDEGYIFSSKMFDRQNHILTLRKGFNINNSPIMELKQNKLLDNSVNSEKTIVNSELIHIVKNSIVKDSIEKNTIEKNSIKKDSIKKDSKVKRTTNQIREDLNLIYLDVPNWESKLYAGGLDKFVIDTNSHTYEEVELLREFLQS